MCTPPQGKLAVVILVVAFWVVVSRGRGSEERVDGAARRLRPPAGRGSAAEGGPPRAAVAVAARRRADGVAIARPRIGRSASIGTATSTLLGVGVRQSTVGGLKTASTTSRDAVASSPSKIGSKWGFVVIWRASTACGRALPPIPLSRTRLTIRLRLVTSRGPPYPTGSGLLAILFARPRR